MSGSAAAALGVRGSTFAEGGVGERPLSEVGYQQVTVKSAPHLAQLENTRGVLMGISNDSLLKPLRMMAGLAAPGEDLGGWYSYREDYNYRTDTVGFAASCTYGQWVSALARNYGMTGDVASRDKVLELNRLYAETIGVRYYEVNRFPAYSYDKLVCGLMDSHRLVRDPRAFRLLDATTDAAVQVLPGHAVEHDVAWRPDRDISWNWDESYTMPENLYLVYGMGAGARYRKLAEQYLNDGVFDALARGENSLAHKHAYSYVNSLCSAMQAYFVDGSVTHLEAARNGFEMLQAQSYATGGWGPDETLQATGSSALYESLTKTHHSFETPCGSYAHMKLTRYLLRATRDGKYGDSMERVMVNTVLGARPLEEDGSTYYYSDYNFAGRRVYHNARWACCSGTLPQVATDYGINSYLQEPGAVWVNLYIPSVLRWSVGANQIQLEQSGDYPLSDAVEFRMTAARPETFALHLRIPAWAEGARVAVNGRAMPLNVTKGFAVLRRTWKSGDVVELEMPSKLRLEAIDAAHPEVVALVRGPLVLFAKTESQPRLTREQVLGARRSAGAEWVIDTEVAASGDTDQGPLRLVPFTEVGDAAYTTYLKLS
jgi:hypothetical protein